MKKQTQAIHLQYERRDAYDALSVPVYNTLAYEFDNAAMMSQTKSRHPTTHVWRILP